MNCTAYIYYGTLMVKCICASLHHPLKLRINKRSVWLCTIQVNQDGFTLRLIYMLSGYDLPIQLLLKSLSSAYNDRLVDHVLIHVTNYEVCSILCLTKGLTCFLTCSLPIHTIAKALQQNMNILASVFIISYPRILMLIMFEIKQIACWVLCNKFNIMHQFKSKNTSINSYCYPLLSIAKLSGTCTITQINTNLRFFNTMQHPWYLTNYNVDNNKM